MKKILLLSVFIFLFFCVMSQNEHIEKLKILTCGNSKLVNNESVIKLEIPTNDYYVILTPIHEYSQLYVFEKSENSFTVKGKDIINCEFDYIVIEKKTKYTEPDYKKNLK